MQRTPLNDNWSVTRLDAGDGLPIPVTLPHDAMLHTQRAATNPGISSQAFFEGGSYRYERTLEVPANWGDRHVLLEFEGVMHDARVFLDGQLIAEHAYGYTPFHVCLDGLVTPGTTAHLVVECTNEDQPDSRWYSGAGIYRPVWLLEGPLPSLEPGCLSVTTLSTEPARIHVDVDAPHADGTFVRVDVLDGLRTIATLEGPGGAGPLSHDFDLPECLPWSAEDPNLYRCRASLVRRHGLTRTEVLDTEVATFGVRVVKWAAGDGLRINGRRLLLRGGCVHHDSGILGAATYDEAEWRRVRRLKEAGYNAIRSAHNPCSRAMLEACDALGMYVMDEAWDMWFEHKSAGDYAGQWPLHHETDLDVMVRRDRNHPSVIMYSIGNEVSEPVREEGVEAARKMVDHLHAADPTRPVTCGINWSIITGSALGMRTYAEGGGRDFEADAKQRKMNSQLFNAYTNVFGRFMTLSANLPVADRVTAPVLDLLDVAGYNYASARYGIDARKHPDRLIVGSETFHADIWHNWEQVKALPNVVGDFVWSSWDYLGEAGSGAWAYTPDGKGFEKPFPWILADQGALDICGNACGQLYLEQVAWDVADGGRAHAADWQPIDPRIAVQPANHPGVTVSKSAWRWTNSLPSWAWKGCEGNRCVVEVFSRAPVVELVLNGRAVSRKRPKRGVASWKLRWEPGELVARALTSGGELIASSRLASAGPAGVQLVAEPYAMPHDDALRPRIVHVDVTIADQHGRVEMNDDRHLVAHVENGELLGFGSARPRTEERYDTGEHTTYYGRAQAVVRVPVGGVATLVVREDNGNETTLDIPWA